MNLAHWYRSLVRTRPDLYRAIYDFNTYPHRWVHASRLATPPPSVLENHAASRRRLSSHYRQHFGLDHTHWDFTTTRTRLALLPSESLTRLAHTVGAVLHSSRLARIIARDERRALTDAIGENAFTYALRRSRSPAPSVTTSDNSSLADEIISSGWQSLANALAAEAVAVQQRFNLKVPRELTLSATDADAADSAWDLVRSVAQETLGLKELSCLA